MAWSLQNQCALEEDFEDEDFLTAVDDVETNFTGSIPTISRGLRPITSGLQSLCREFSTSHRESKAGNYANNLSTALTCQNSILPAAETTQPQRPTSTLRPIGHKQVPAASSESLKITKDALYSECGFSAASNGSTSIHVGNNQQNHSTAAGFCFANQSSSVGDSPDDGLDDDLFLSACTEVELPDPDSQKNRSLLTLEVPLANSTNAQWREQDTSEEPVKKRLRENGQKTLPGSSLQNVGKLKTNPAMQNSPTLSLRPRSVIERQQKCLPESSCPAFASPNVPCCSSLEKPKGTISSYQSERAGARLGSTSEEGKIMCHQASAFFSSMTSPDQPNLEKRAVRLPKSPAPVLNFPHLSKPGSTLQQPPGRPQEPCTLMTSISSPVSSPRMPCIQSSGLNTLQPIVTNHLVQLVTAANQTPQVTNRTSLRTKTRRFPGPAGILPQQVSGKNLEEILISTPHTPTHGALAQMRTQVMSSSQQTVEEEFSRGPWMSMKAELGLDENNSACFLHTYSVIMVLRKAALKQLPKSKVPNMAVVLKSLVRANVDASAVFKDPTGEMQGTLHHLLLEEREGELKAGSVLLLQQVPRPLI